MKTHNIFNLGIVFAAGAIIFLVVGYLYNIGFVVFSVAMLITALVQFQMANYLKLLHIETEVKSIKYEQTRQGMSLNSFKSKINKLISN